MKVLDTTVLISALRGIEEARAIVRPAIDEGVAAASVLSRVEIEGTMRSDERSAVSRMLANLQLVSVSDLIASRAGEFMRLYRRSHHNIDLVDYVIAATAEVMRADLLTLNVRHFPMFEGLEPAF